MRSTVFSSRRRAIGSLWVSIIGILSVVGFFSHAVSQHEIDEIFDARLATTARVLESMVARQLEKATIESPLVITLPAALEVSDSDGKIDSGHPYESKIAFQVWDADNKLLARSATAPTIQLGPLMPGFSRAEYIRDSWQTFTLKSGSVWIVAAEKNEIRDEIADEISLAILIPILLGGLILTLTVNWIAIQAMKPIQELAEAISSRDPLALDPIHLSRPQEELTPVVDQLNLLFDKVQDLRSREKKFIDYAAHELRTPITALQLHVQNALESSRAEDQIDALNNSLEASRRATHLADQLLAYSRLQVSEGVGQKCAVYLNQLCQSVIESVKPIADSRKQTIKFQCLGDEIVHGFADQLESLFRNLLENALYYGDTPGQIRVCIQHSNEEIELLVENTGKPIAKIDRERIFNPYVRLLGNRSSGSGLGLAIVREIVKQHEAFISVEDLEPNNGVRFRVRFQSAISYSKT